MLSAQTLTEAEALDYIARLRAVDMITEKGADHLVETISTETLRRRVTPLFPPRVVYSSDDTVGELSRSSLLRALAELFTEEQAFRQNQPATLKLQLELIERAAWSSVPTPEQQDSFQLAFLREFRTLPGIRIEVTIAERLGLNQEQLLGALLPPGVSYRMPRPAPNVGYISESRSAVGLTLQKTVTD